jgi:hypothetical protein
MAYRTRLDAAANTGQMTFAVDAATTVAIGDLMWHDVDDAKPASHTGLWTGTEAGSAGKLAERFLGVAQAAHNSSSANLYVANRTTIEVQTLGVYEYPCTSATFEIGDRVRGKKDTGGNFFLAQEVEKTTNDSLAIGKVTKRYATATTKVEFQILGVVNPGGQKAYLSS